MRYLVIAAASVLVACAGPAADTEPNPDDDKAAALVLCPDAVAVLEDAQDGLLTRAEFREEFRPVVERAEGTAVENEVKGLMRAVTQGWSQGEVDQGVTLLMMACDRAAADD